MSKTTAAMNVSLTPQLEDLVRRKVESGRYNSASEVIRDALRLLEEEDKVRELRLEALREKIQRGVDQLDQGLGTPWDVEEFKGRARAHYKERNTRES